MDVQLVFDRSVPLGIKTTRREGDDGGAPIITVSEFVPDGYAASVCRAAKLGPGAFAKARVVGVNGKGAPHTKDFLSERPVSIMFRLREDASGPGGRGRGVGVNRRRGNVVQLVFREGRSLGIQISKATRREKGVLKVVAVLRHSQGGDILKECRWDPESFEGATILGVDGRTYRDANEMYEVIKRPSRPKAILFELSPPHPSDGAAAAGARTAGRASASRVNRKASSALLRSAVFATESVRQLSGEEGRGGAPRRRESRHSQFARTQDINNSIRELSKESKLQLALRMEEMEKMNAICEMEAVNAENEAFARRTSTEVPAAPAGNERETPVMSRARKVLGGFRSPRPRRVSRVGRSSSSDSMGSLGDFDGNRSITETKEFEMADEETQREMLIKESREACLKAIRDHLELFLLETPSVTYEEWIEELHPENAKSKRNVVKGKSIDHRFYVEESDHRNLWNENLGGEREYVPVREYVYT